MFTSKKLFPGLLLAGFLAACGPMKVEPPSRFPATTLREFLRLHFEHKLSARAIARSLSISASTAQGYVSRIRVAALSWPLPAELESDAALTRVLFAEVGVVKDKRAPDWAEVHLELKKKLVTKQLLWEEYKTEQPNGYQYSQFC